MFLRYWKLSTLTLIRHAQASFLEEDYDRLSPLGERQASLLGEYWAKTGAGFDSVFCGPRRRHIRTFELAAAACCESGVRLPEPVVLQELDEYRADEVMRVYLEPLAERYGHIRSLDEDYRRVKGTPDAARYIELLFRAVTTMWVGGEFDSSKVENWERFCRRVQTGLAQTRNHGAKGASIAVFTSAGPTAVAMQAALNLEAQTTLELSWLVRNSACSTFLFSGDRFSLWSFNEVPHLQEPALVTYR